MTDERRMGLVSTFILKCKMCGLKQHLSSDNINDKTQLSINSAITLGAVTSGIGYAQLSEISAAINMPMMTDKTYLKCHEEVSSFICDSAWKSMREAAKEEAELAINDQNVDKNGIPCITVVTDGAWSKRSYNVNYDALSGVVS